MPDMTNNDEKSLLEGTLQGLPARRERRKAQPEPEPEPAAITPTVVERPAARRPGAQERVTVEIKQVQTDPASGEPVINPQTGKPVVVTREQSYTFTLPGADKYARIMGRRFVIWGTDFVMQKTPRLRALMMECIDPKPAPDTPNYVIESLLSRFWVFLRQDQPDPSVTLDLETPRKPHDVVNLKSPFTGNIFALFIPTAAELQRVLPQTEERADLETGDTKVELSIYDAFLDKYLDPPLTPQNMAAMLPAELEWLEFAVYLFRRTVF